MQAGRNRRPGPAPAAPYPTELAVLSEVCYGSANRK